MNDAASAAGIRVLVNGEPHEVPAGCTLEALLAQIGIAPESAATAVNGEFVPRAQRGAKVLAAGDSLTCFQPITGG